MPNTIDFPLEKIVIKLDVAGQYPGFINLTEVDTLEAEIANGGTEQFAGQKYYIKPGPVKNLCFEMGGSPSLHTWVEAGSSPNLTNIMTEGSFGGTALYLFSFEGTTLTQPTGAILDIQLCDNLTTINFVGDPGHLTLRSCPLVDTLELTPLTEMDWFDCPSVDLDTATIDDVISLCVDSSLSTRRFVSNGSASPTMSSPTASSVTVDFNATTSSSGYIIWCGRLFYDLTGGAVGAYGLEYPVDLSGVTTPEDYAAAFTAVIEANGSSVVDNLDGTMDITCDSLGPHSNIQIVGLDGTTSSGFSEGTGNADLATLVSLGWEVGY